MVASLLRLYSGWMALTVASTRLLKKWPLVRGIAVLPGPVTVGGTSTSVREALATRPTFGRFSASAWAARYWAESASARAAR